DGTLVVEVRDTGIGIPPDQLETIFESFRQVETGLSRNYPGLGLGLALVRKLTRLMNGEITVESTPDVGSTFKVRLPLRLPADAHAPTIAQTRPEWMPTILAVEDNPIGLMVLQHALERGHLNVESASSGPEALAAASKRRFDLVLMDLQMPGMDGIETTGAMR